MAAECGDLYFMFLGPPLSEVSGSATEPGHILVIKRVGGVAPEVNLRVYTLHIYVSIKCVDNCSDSHSGIEIQKRCQNKSKTGASSLYVKNIKKKKSYSF